MPAIQSGFSKWFDFPRIARRPLTHTQLLNRNQSFLVRFWIIPGSPAPVPLDKGNRGSRDDIEMIVDVNSSKNKFITTAHIPLARGRYSWC